MESGISVEEGIYDYLNEIRVLCLELASIVDSVRCRVRLTNEYSEQSS
jgi:hypothetical protein